MDTAGNTATCTFVITVVDNTPPAFAGCPSNMTVFTGANATTCNAPATWTAPTATDNCGTPTVTVNHASGSIFSIGTTTVTYTAMDAAGNTATCTFVVTVVDNTPLALS